MRRRALALAILLAAADASAWCRTTTVPEQPDPTVCPTEGRPLAWPGSCAAFRFDPSVVPDPARVPAAGLRDALNRAARAWSSRPCGSSGRPPSFALSRLADGPSSFGYDPTGRNVNTVRFLTTWSRDAFHPPDAAAVTIVTFGPRTGDILDADTELNLRATESSMALPFSLQGDPESADLETILTHEFGHALGLAHSADRGAVMWYSAGRGELRREPTADDLEGACRVHPPERLAVCEEEVTRDLIRGDGVRCAARPEPSHQRAWWIPLALLLAVSARRRR